jgi:hypothetical protein
MDALPTRAASDIVFAAPCAERAGVVGVLRRPADSSPFLDVVFTLIEPPQLPDAVGERVAYLVALAACQVRAQQVEHRTDRVPHVDRADVVQTLADMRKKAS